MAENVDESKKKMKKSKLSRFFHGNKNDEKDRKNLDEILAKKQWRALNEVNVKIQSTVKSFLSQKLHRELILQKSGLEKAEAYEKLLFNVVHKLSHPETTKFLENMHRTKAMHDMETKDMNPAEQLLRERIDEAVGPLYFGAQFLDKDKAEDYYWGLGRIINKKTFKKAKSGKMSSSSSESEMILNNAQKPELPSANNTQKSPKSKSLTGVNENKFLKLKATANSPGPSEQSSIETILSPKPSTSKQLSDE